MSLHTRPAQWLPVLMWLGVGLAVGAGIGYSVLFDQPALAPPTSPTQIERSSPGVISLPTPTSGADRMFGLRVGNTAPGFSLTTLDGAVTVSLAQFEGQPVLINFWASWCLPCRSETPALELAYQEYQPQGLVILGINTAAQDTLKETQSFADEFDVSYPLLWGETDEVPDAYGILGLPTSVFLDTEGRGQRVYIGGMSDAQIKEFIAEILG